MYAAERTKPPVPLKIDDKSKPSPVAPTQSSIQEETTEGAASQEFNQLANLIGLAAADTSGLDFKLNLFPEAVCDVEGGRLGGASADPGQIINIDLGKTSKD
jgi:hypothetical protein